MKFKLALVFAVVALGAVAGASTADAHYLCGCKAYKAAQTFAKRSARRVANEQGTTVTYIVKKPCSYRTAHRWVCDSAFRWTAPDGSQVFCTMKIISRFASADSYRVIAKGTGANCN